MLPLGPFTTFVEDAEAREHTRHDELESSQEHDTCLL